MASMASSRTLGLLAKQPRPGHVKSRLAAQTSPQWAAEVAEAFLRDLVERLAKVEARRVLVHDPPEAYAYFASLAGGQFALAAQTEGDLGRRIAAFLAEELAAGARQVVLLGSDSPTVPLAYIERAFHELERAELVLGPAADGGYYLIGCAGRVPPVFDGIGWGGSGVLYDTVACLADAGCRLALLPPWYDVDTLDAWSALRGHLAAMRRAGIDPQVPFTEAIARRAV